MEPISAKTTISPTVNPTAPPTPSPLLDFAGDSVALSEPVAGVGRSVTVLTCPVTVSRDIDGVVIRVPDDFDADEVVWGASVLEL